MIAGILIEAEPPAAIRKAPRNPSIAHQETSRDYTAWPRRTNV